jgi:hypothetical protein
MHRPIVFAVEQNAMASFATPSLKKKSPLKKQQPRKLLQRRLPQRLQMTPQRA